MDEKSKLKRIKAIVKSFKISNHRLVVVLVGNGASEKVPLFYDILATYNSKVSILWCGKEIDQNNIISRAEDEVARASQQKTEYCSYEDITEFKSGTFKMVVLQDYNPLTPSVVSQASKLVSGGGLLFFLVPQASDFSKESTSSITKNHPFKQRLSFSLSFTCPSCVIFDHDLNLLSSKENFETLPKVVEPYTSEELQTLKCKHADDAVLAPLLNLCLTVEQAALLVQCVELLKRRTLHTALSMASSQGRGKSAVLGLTVAAALALQYSNIFVSSLNYSSVDILFKFLFKGLDALDYQEDKDYDIIGSVNPELEKALIGINVFKNHPQAVRFIFPADVRCKLDQAELVVVEDAASIPLSVLQRFAGSHILFMASTINENNGCGKFLYDNVIETFQSSKYSDSTAQLKKDVPSISHKFDKVWLSEPINYAADDDMEAWASKLLYLQSETPPPLRSGCPEPQRCELFYVNTNLLFTIEAQHFLQQMMSLFYCCKRTIRADYFSEIVENQDYYLFCLLPPAASLKNPSEILCVILVHIEKGIPTNIVHFGSNKSKPDLCCFQEWRNLDKRDAYSMDVVEGVHILDMVTHPQYIRMGYGSRALQLLQEFYEGKWISLDEEVDSRSECLLLPLTQEKPDRMYYLFASFYLTSQLLRFWKKAGYFPVFLSSEKNCASEHVCYMLKGIDKQFDEHQQECWRCFKEYYFILLSSACRDLPSSFALSLLHSNANKQLLSKDLTKSEIDFLLKPHRMKSLEKYCQNLSDFHCVVPCIPALTKLYFRYRFKDVTLPLVQEAILLSLGVQRKTIAETAEELGLPVTQIHGLVNRTIKKLTKYLSNVIEKSVEKAMVTPDIVMQPLSQNLDEELQEAAEKIKEQMENVRKLDFSEYAIKGSEDDWEKALHCGRKTLVSIKSIKKKPVDQKEKSGGKPELFKVNQKKSFKAKSRKK